MGGKGGVGEEGVGRIGLRGSDRVGGREEGKEWRGNKEGSEE